MQPIDRYVETVLARLNGEGPVHEEPDLEIKARYPSKPDAESLWSVADLLASLANTLSIVGPRALVYGPARGLERPSWFTDEAVVADKLRKCFDGAVMPGFEVLRRCVTDRAQVDVFVLYDCSETPYVTFHQHNGFPVVRTRSNTARRTARRSELLALCGTRGVQVPEASLRAGVRASGGLQILWVQNTGSVVVRDVRIDLEPVRESGLLDVQPQGWASGDVVIPELMPGEGDGVSFYRTPVVGSQATSVRALVFGTAPDGTDVTTTVILSPHSRPL